MRISDWSSDVCSSDLGAVEMEADRAAAAIDDRLRAVGGPLFVDVADDDDRAFIGQPHRRRRADPASAAGDERHLVLRSEEHTSELQSLMRISYAVLGL